MSKAVVSLLEKCKDLLSDVAFMDGVDQSKEINFGRRESRRNSLLDRQMYE